MAKIRLAGESNCFRNYRSTKRWSTIIHRVLHHSVIIDLIALTSDLTRRDEYYNFHSAKIELIAHFLFVPFPVFSNLCSNGCACNGDVTYSLPAKIRRRGIEPLLTIEGTSPRGPIVGNHPPFPLAFNRVIRRGWLTSARKKGGNVSENWKRINKQIYVLFYDISFGTNLCGV